MFDRKGIPQQSWTNLPNCYVMLALLPFSLVSKVFPVQKHLCVTVTETLTCQLDCLEKGIAHYTTRIRNLRQTLRNLASWTDLQFSTLLQASGVKCFKWIKVIIACSKIMSEIVVCSGGHLTT